MALSINGVEIRSGQELKEVLGPELWDKFVDALAEALTPKVMNTMVPRIDDKIAARVGA